MTQRTIELPDETAVCLERQVSAGRGNSLGDVVTKARKIHRETEAIADAVLAADLASNATPVTPETFDSLRDLARDRQEKPC